MTLSAERNERQEQRQEQRQDALAWLRSALWHHDADVAYVPVGAGDPAARWLARPDAEAPELLVPAAPRRASAAVSRRFWDGMPARRRARQWVGEAVLRSGLAQRLWPGRVALVGADADTDDPERSVLAALAAHLDLGPLLVAVTLRPEAYNGKPILQLFRSDGTAVAFAKVAVDDITAEYVRTEVDWLRRAVALPGPVRAPGLLGALDWHGRPIAVVEPLALPRLPRRRRPDGLARAVTDIAALGEQGDVAAAHSGVIARCRREEADRPTGDGFAELVDAVVDDHGDTTLAVGAWHGDLSPWNTATDGSGLLVWDWELAADGLPVGADLLHHHVMVASHLGGVDADTAVGAVLDGRVPELAAVGVPSARHAAVRDLYLLEQVRRDRRSDLQGRPDPTRRLGDAAGRRLRASR